MANAQISRFDPEPVVPANHSLANIGQDIQRTAVGLAIAAIGILCALGYVDAAHATAGISVVLGAHYVTT